MKEDPFVGVYRALSPKELAEMFMNPHAPKTEAEHWAVREIEKLRAEVERLTRQSDEARYFLKIFVHAHASGNAVPPHLEDQAREALGAKP